ncbi:extensin-like [Homalodisca vitripennis]|uniref:extensin-like n=1 Tax=Homalodisca vitripennis TaxID=197043 RepID=UPI001EE9BA08|nr:extensin-like [Homalodisca vitripennis]
MDPTAALEVMYEPKRREYPGQNETHSSSCRDPPASLGIQSPPKKHPEYVLPQGGAFPNPPNHNTPSSSLTIIRCIPHPPIPSLTNTTQKNPPHPPTSRLPPTPQPPHHVSLQPSLGTLEHAPSQQPQTPIHPTLIVTLSALNTLPHPTTYSHIPSPPPHPPTHDPKTPHHKTPSASSPKPPDRPAQYPQHPCPPTYLRNETQSQIPHIPKTRFYHKSNTPTPNQHTPPLPSSPLSMTLHSSPQNNPHTTHPHTTTPSHFVPNFKIPQSHEIRLPHHTSSQCHPRPPPTSPTETKRHLDKSTPAHTLASPSIPSHPYPQPPDKPVNLCYIKPPLTPYPDQAPPSLPHTPRSTQPLIKTNPQYPIVTIDKQNFNSNPLRNLPPPPHHPTTSPSAPSPDQPFPYRAQLPI